MDDFAAADLVRSVGVADAGAELVDVYAAQMPRELSAALHLRVNAKLTDGLTETDHATAAKIAGRRLEAVTVRGGDRSPADAMVVAVHFDRRGTPMKLCFPYRDLAAGESSAVVSQAAAVAAAIRDTEAARALELQRAQDSGVLAELEAERAERERLQRELEARSSDPDPEAEQKAAAVAAENEELRKRLAELEAERAGGSEDGESAGSGERDSTEPEAPAARPRGRRSGR